MMDDEITNYINNFKEMTGKRYMWKLLPVKYQKYILAKYNDSLSKEESVYRLIHNIDIRPTCLNCGRQINFDIKKRRFSKFCCHRCLGLYQSPFKQKDIQNKIKKNLIKKYGVDNVLRLKEFHDKAKQTKLSRYGDENYCNHEKFKETCLKKYGCEYPSQNKAIRKKQIATSIKKYGGVFNKEKVSETIKRKYGVDWFVYSDKLKQRANSDEAHRKSYLTKKKNHSFGPQSLSESICYLYLSLCYPDTIRQYRDNDKYPYNCDFYIPSLDLFVEFQGYYTHGFHPFNPHDINDQNRLNELRKRYDDKDQIIDVWINKDPEKRECAKKNNLNWIEFFTINELRNWLENG